MEGIAWDEFARIHVAGDEERHGLALEVDRDLAVVQVLEGTSGLGPGTTRVSFEQTRWVSALGGAPDRGGGAVPRVTVGVRARRGSCIAL